MSSNTKRTILFTVEKEKHKQELTDIAKMQGFFNLSAMARFAVFQYLKRYKLIERLAVQRRRNQAEIPELYEIMGD